MEIKTSYKGIKGFTEMLVNSTAEIKKSSLTQYKNASLERKREYPSYIIEENNYIGDFIENKMVRNILKRIADRCYGEQIIDIERESSKLSQYNYPSFYQIYKYCCTTLCVDKVPDVFITNKIYGINALSVEVLNRRVILINRKTVISLTPEEQAFVLGHELGHHQQGNLVCHTVNGLLESFKGNSDIIGSLVIDSIEIPLKRWCRVSEFNADRAGYLCCRNLEIIENLFSKIGLCKNRSQLDEYHELLYAHPLLFTRLKELKEYIKAIEYDY